MIVLAPHVRTIADQDGAIVLDIKRNATFGLDPTTTFIWRRLEQSLPVGEIVKQLVQETQENPTVVEADVHHFIQELKQKNMIVERTDVFDKKRAIRQAFVLFVLYDLFVPPISVLRRRSLWLIHCTLSMMRVVPILAPPQRTSEICSAIDIACSWYPKKVKCLQRSVVATLMLRRAGIGAQFVAAAQKLPFAAHAWVEIDGQVIMDQPEYVHHFLIFERC